MGGDRGASGQRQAGRGASGQGGQGQGSSGRDRVREQREGQGQGAGGQGAGGQGAGGAGETSLVVRRAHAHRRQHLSVSGAPLLDLGCRNLYLDELHGKIDICNLNITRSRGGECCNLYNM